MIGSDLRKMAKKAFEERKLDSKKRIEFLKAAKILDENGNLNKFLSHSVCERKDK